MKISSFDNHMVTFERRCSKASKTPILGIFAGGLKIITGTFQMITALVIIVLLAIPLFLRNRKILRWAASHVVHGFINIVNGAIEATPLIGTMVIHVREDLTKGHVKKFKSRLLNVNNDLKEPCSMTWINYKSVKESKFQNNRIAWADDSETLKNNAMAYLAVL